MSTMMARTDIFQNLQADQQSIIKNQNVLFDTMRFLIKASTETQKTVRDFDETLAQLIETMPDLEKLEMRVAELEQTVKKLETALGLTNETQSYAIQTQIRLFGQLSKELQSEEILGNFDRLEQSNDELSQRVAEVEKNSDEIRRYLSALDDLMQTIADSMNQEVESDGTA